MKSLVAYYSRTNTTKKLAEAIANNVNADIEEIIPKVNYQGKLGYARLFMGFLRQEYWSGLPFPSPGDLPNSGIEPESPAWQADSLPLSHLGRTLAHSKPP